MATTQELGPAAIRRTYDPEEFDFNTTDELADQTEAVGQPRAVAAVEFATGINRAGYNTFALGAPGTGKHSLVQNHLQKRATERPVPPDVCYVHNFERADEPRLLKMAPGQGSVFRRDMEKLAGGLKTALRSAFESEEYQTRRQVIEDEFKERPRHELRDVEERAKVEGLVLLRSPTGIAFTPTRDGEVLSSEEFLKLPVDEQEKLQKTVEAFQDEVQSALRNLPSWDRDRQEKVKELEQEVIGLAVDNLLGELRKKYEGDESILDHLKAVFYDVLDHAKEIVEHDSVPHDGGQQPAAMQTPAISVRRYHVNLAIDNRLATGAPVVYEDNPIYENLVGRIEHSTPFGGLTTDHTLIKPGSLFRANGGYLIVDAHRLLQAPYAWEALKRALQLGRLRIEMPGQQMNIMSAVSITPEPLELDVQVVLLGNPMLYYLLCEKDPDFEELFKVTSDFAERMDATEENRVGYVRLLAMLARKDGLKPFDKSAMAALLEHGARLAGDQDMLTARIGMLHDVLREANFWADRSSSDVVSSNHIWQAIEAGIHRVDRIRERTYEQIRRGTIMIDVDGKKIGQVNGLAVLSTGNFAFGRPNRLTARVRLGQGDVVDIEREVELGGPIHSKGVLILAAFLGARYAANRPLSLSASIVFEQSYSGVDGDSASAAESFALLSAIAEIPVRQDLAVTGSVNQHGEVQAIGGANEKIEGFFDVCRAIGLTGTQGVVIPAANVRHLMLRQDVVDAVSSGQFHIYPIERIDEGIELLTGITAGDPESTGQYPEGTVNRIVEDRLAEMAERKRAYDSQGGDTAPQALSEEK